MTTSVPVGVPRNLRCRVTRCRGLRAGAYDPTHQRAPSHSGRSSWFGVLRVDWSVRPRFCAPQTPVLTLVQVDRDGTRGRCRVLVVCALFRSSLLWYNRDTLYVGVYPRQCHPLSLRRQFRLL